MQDLNYKLSKVAIVGKPNVGKSTLINRLCGQRDAIVHKDEMITRDRKYYKTDWNGFEFYILDTGGVDIKSGQRLASQIFNQTIKAIEESDIIIFIVDIKSPMTPLDEEIASLLRKLNKPIIFVANKWDNLQGSYHTDDYLKLGFDFPIKVSAIHGININELLDEIAGNLKKINRSKKITSTIVEEKEKNIPNISILGKPNVGKSTLFNTIIREERVIVDEVEGTTRDSIDSIINFNNNNYRFIDTAGMKKNKRKEADLEYYSKIRTLKVIEKSDICLVLIDSTKEISNQDQNIVNICVQKGSSICIIFNKIDIVSKESINKNIESMDIKLDYAKFIPFLKISALKKTGVNDIFKMIDFLMEQRSKKIPDKKLIEMFKDLQNNNPVYSKGKKFKVKFIKQIKVSPPGFFIFSNIDIKKKKNIKRYIENNIRKNFSFTGTPLFFKYKY